MLFLRKEALMNRRCSQQGELQQNSSGSIFGMQRRSDVGRRLDGTDRGNRDGDEWQGVHVDYSDNSSGYRTDVQRRKPWFTLRLNRRGILLSGLMLVISVLMLVIVLSDKTLSQSSSSGVSLAAPGTDDSPEYLQKPDADIGEGGVWSRSYKLLTDRFHETLQAGWKRLPSSQQGLVPLVTSPSQARCAPPNQSLDHDDFYLGGQAFDRIPSPSTDSLQPRGVVISASGTVPRLAIGAYITSYLIRRIFHCDLPIEIYYVGQREAFPEELKQALVDLGNVKVIDLLEDLEKKYGYYVQSASSTAGERAEEDESAVARDKETPSHAKGEMKSAPSIIESRLSYLNPSIEQLASYAAKPYSILVSSFQENLLFDAGAVPFIDAPEFFSLPSYVSSGFIEFRDYVPSTPYKWDWIPEEYCVDTEAVLDYYQGTEGDSSCVIFDKVKNWDALLVTTIFNGPLQHITYQKLNGDKDTWIMAMMYVRQRPMDESLETVPGFLFVDYEGNYEARKVHGQLQLLKKDFEPVEKERRERNQDEPMNGVLVPLYFNNQLFNFSQWQYNKGWTYVGSYDDYGSLYNPPTSLSPDCRPYSVDELDPLTSVMNLAFDGVVEALKSIDSHHCACRDDWPSQCVVFIY